MRSAFDAISIEDGLSSAFGVKARELEIDVIIDWSALSAADNQGATGSSSNFDDDLEWGALPARVTVIPSRQLDAPPGYAAQRVLTPDQADGILAEYIEASWIDSRDLLLCFSSALPNTDVIGKLRTALDSDHLFCAAAPRIGLDSSGDVLGLADRVLQPEHTSTVGRQYLSCLEPFYALPEHLPPCLLFKASFLASLTPEMGEGILSESVAKLLHWARRRGFRIVVDNRAIVTVGSTEPAMIPLAAGLRQPASEEDHNDATLAVRAYARHPGRELERLIARGVSSNSEQALLLDCTGMMPTFNGTSVSILSVLGGIVSLEPMHRIIVMVNAAAAEFHQLATRFPSLELAGPQDDVCCGVAIRLSQAWSLSTFFDLHRHAPVVGIAILDTIATDILYAAPAGAEEAFAFAGQMADGLMYLSGFTRDLFRHRFRIGEGVLEAVYYQSLDPSDYLPERVPEPWAETHVLVIGNSYDHKDTNRTACLLAETFPHTKVVALGADIAPFSNVQVVKSGLLPDSEIDRLYASAQCVVYPSFYEGFGLPVLKALAHGRPVVARDSPLLRELAENISGNGQLLAFQGQLDMVQLVGQVLHGIRVESIPLGAAIGPGGTALSWGGVARRVLAFSDEMCARFEGDQWRRRDDALRWVAAPR